ncbi:O-antigen ligase family protein [Pseudoalteromonas sp. L23]|uniref:O-antigen ligase family protein n=1 Tax=Pseudoalteromonas TaxID=53246 RepID=UPI00029B0A5E|nr:MULTISPECIES: O-antigen ligase family protein [Pseudoalteromonas]MCF7513912.1 O-antigen ligase family protein [Pseudoalteromonas sp. L7]MCF7525953.1 O-antigen ligase family protein [Pseudoalteromonas sp. L23]
MQRASFPQFVTFAAIFLLFYWPTYFIPSIAPTVMQKSYFIVMLGMLTISILATRTKFALPSLAYVYLLPTVAMLITFPFQWQHFSSFHFGVLIKPFFLFFYTAAFFSLLRTHFQLQDLPKLTKVLLGMMILQLVFIALQIILGDIPALKIINSRQVYAGFGFRAPGTFEWVYITCYVLSFFLVYCIMEFFLGKKKVAAGISITFIFLAIFLSQSKTGYLATAIIAIYFSALSVALNLGIAKKLLILKGCFIGLAILAILQLDINLQYIVQFIELMSSGELDGSTSTRKAQTITALSQGLEYWYSGSPLAYDGVIIENTYLDYLFRYGLFGLIAITSVLIIFYFYSLKVCFTSRRHIATLGFTHLKLSVSAHLSVTAAILYAFTGTPLDAYRSALWSAFVAALMVYLDYLSKDHIKST